MSGTVRRRILSVMRCGRWNCTFITPLTWLVLALCPAIGGLWPHLRPASGTPGRAPEALLKPAVAAPTLPLHKPEIGMLLARAEQIGLRPEQQIRLRALDRRWQQERAVWQEHLEQAIRNAGHLLQGERTRGGVAIPAVISGLRNYSHLSQAYDRRRAFWWERGLETLRPEQRRRVLRSVLPGSSGRK